MFFLFLPLCPLTRNILELEFVFKMLSNSCNLIHWQMATQTVFHTPSYHIAPFILENADEDIFFCAKITISDYYYYCMLPNSGTAILIRKGNTELSLLVGFLLFTVDDFSKPSHSMLGTGIPLILICLYQGGQD